MRIVIVDDHPMVRKGLTSILSLEEDIEVVGEATNVKEAIDIIKKTQPEQVLIDLRLGEECGLDIPKKMGNSIGCKFTVLTSSVEKTDFKRAEEAGVYGYILKEAFPDEIIYAIRVVGRGRKYFDPGIMEMMMKKDENKIVESLTEREIEVLEALGRGLCNKDIAKTLFITEYTVKKHVSQVLAKLNLTDRTQAALYANKVGLFRD